MYHLPEPAEVYAEVFDLLGRLMYTSPVQKVAAGWNHTLSLDLPETSSGLYIYRINVETVLGTWTRTGRIIQVR
ncbi:MAG: T9SS type A sorting domain-containing protein [Rhodothermaceae bacterium]|nr:T9SS type A sorting domain-containing protein [Bacteroidota bacterium]MXW15383.1 T9SS type A sorting domain-containing protein [Rhodothermaceae bacterium]MDE2646272.1 T9SS type A sorting domain-containing protein [Bacteroidota bacterium]MXW31543.1 T9SS type A sorting domain-containing protein [Rhodothermaceae bacterium]MXZ18601.1 T9SS type A sorting domain-containing protein [Rhodothermaceae bacterium]